MTGQPHPAPAWHVSLRGAREPQTLSRVLNLFVQRDILLETVSVAPEGDHLRIEIRDIALDAHAMSVLIEKLRAMIVVSDLRLIESIGNQHAA